MLILENQLADAVRDSTLLTPEVLASTKHPYQPKTHRLLLLIYRAVGDVQSQVTAERQSV
jgi:hypothetical protein